MFFKNIADYSKSKMRMLTIICLLIYTCLLLVGPTVVICCRYDLFVATSARYKLSGVGLIFFVGLLGFVYTRIKRSLESLPQTTLNQQRFKFTVQMIWGLLPIVLIWIAFIFAKDDVERAYNTMLICMGFVIGAHVFDGLVLRYIDAENSLRAKALEMNEIDRRRPNV